jgi:hypothetical protein
VSRLLIGKPLAGGTFEDQGRAAFIVDAHGGAMTLPEIELREVTVQVLFLAML